MKWRLRLQPVEAADVLRRLSPGTKRPLKEALGRLLKDPSGSEGSLDIRTLQSDDPGPPVFRLRVGDWRVVYELRDDEIRVLRIFPRRDGYKWMERLGFLPSRDGRTREADDPPRRRSRRT